MFADKRAEWLLETMLSSMRGKRANEHDVTLVRGVLASMGKMSVGARRRTGHSFPIVRSCRVIHSVLDPRLLSETASCDLASARFYHMTLGVGSEVRA